MLFRSFSVNMDAQMSHLHTCVDIIFKLCESVISPSQSLDAQDQHRFIADLMSSAYELPSLDNGDVTTQNVISLFARRIESIGFVKYYFSRMLHNISNEVLLLVDYELNVSFDDEGNIVKLDDSF